MLLSPTRRISICCRICILSAIWLHALSFNSANAEKTESTFYPAGVAQRIRDNAAQSERGREVRKAAIAAAHPWLDMSDDALWKLMFAPGIQRSWMVWSNGYCPACREGVPMYSWSMDALSRPWKVRCPHCGDEFPTNDFQKFYESGLDGRGYFAAERADQNLLTPEKPPTDLATSPSFGVDAGEGYREGDAHWRFIGAYLVYGQWKQAVYDGIRHLAAAHVLTGNPMYAHKAGILLDRVADVWPDFDFQTQAVVYEQKLGSNGYVSIWHDTCIEVRNLTVAYDMVFGALRNDGSLVEFLSTKAAEHGLENSKRSFADVQRNIEERILLDAIANEHKIYSNFPQQQITMATIWAVLGIDKHRSKVNELVDGVLAKATAVDGVTGEKGLSGYSAYAVNGLAELLVRFSQLDPDFLPDAVRRFPNLRKTFRFHIDTHCLDRYYPQSGDCGAFAAPAPNYVGITASRSPSPWQAVQPSKFSLLSDFHALTGDVAYLQTIAWLNGDRVDAFPLDLHASDQIAHSRKIRDVVAAHGPRPRRGSVNFEQWCLAILRSGQGEQARAVWLDYDSGGNHGHRDGMNLGLFAYGLDLMPDFGYPPVQFGGWTSEKALWYTRSASHNTVVVDQQDSSKASGTTTLWADTSRLKAMRADGPELNRGCRFERTAALVDVADDAFYLVDVFRVAGGRQHVKFVHSHFGATELSGVAANQHGENEEGILMRNVRWDTAPATPWQVEWKIDDRYKLLQEPREVRVRITDWTANAAAGTAEAWVVENRGMGGAETWIPRVMVRRAAPTPNNGEDAGPLESTFIAIVDPYDSAPTVANSQRLDVHTFAGESASKSHVALRIDHDLGRDVLLLADSATLGQGGLRILGSPEIRTDAQAALVRFAHDGKIVGAAVANGSQLACGDFRLEIAPGETSAEAFSESD